MKITKLLCLTIAAAVSANSYALEIYNGKITKHKEWTTGGAKASYVTSSNGASPARFSRQKSQDHRSQDFKQAAVAAAQGAVNVPMIIDNRHYVFFDNDTTEVKTISYTYSVCSKDSDKMNQCVYYQNEAILQPGGYMSDDIKPVLEITYTTPGKYRVQASTSVTEFGPGSNGTATSSADVTIS